MGSLVSREGKTILGPEQALRTLRFEGQGARLEERTSVLVWNIQKQKAHGFAEAFQRLALGRQLLLLQEVHLSGAAKFLTDSGHGYEMAASFAYPDGSSTGVAIGSTAVPNQVKLGITEDVEPVVGTPKAFLMAEYNLPAPGQRLLAATIHGINRADWKSHGAFERQLDNLVEQLETHQGPMILAGDFNTQNKKKNAYLEAAVERLRLVPVVFDPDIRTVSKLTRHPLDHAFVRGLRVEDPVCWSGGSDHVALTFSVLVETS
ncbi:unnamed protein product [Polarella glacialis]|uniref:Endonuclease/exonuclease/phosphatase domain-containing protein n=1 Tax=Polarella glacialis TaxID=89957 RepID=A0A813K2U9_POLGL|nr:unnamed protein product [Polarella glacialis]